MFLRVKQFGEFFGAKLRCKCRFFDEPDKLEGNANLWISGRRVIVLV